MNRSTLFAKAANIKLFVMDVDGILTDGKVTYSSAGEELKSFTTQDGQAIKLLQKAGVKTAIITGRNSPMVERRANELGIEFLYQGNDKKINLLKALAEELNLKPHQIAYIGDDLPDLAPIQWCGFGITPDNGRDILKSSADWVLVKKGGESVMVEIVDLILESQGKLDEIISAYLLD